MPRKADRTKGPETPSRAAVELVGTESDMLIRLQRGERRMQALFFDKYERDVRRVLVRVLGTSPDVADALQDTFMRALGNVSQVKDAQALRSWLLRVTVTVALDQLRRRRRLRWLVFSNDASLEVPVDGVSPELRAVLLETYRVLDRLPAEERVAFALRHIQEMELEEIADACGVSLSTIKRRHSKAASRVRTIPTRQPGLADGVNEEAFR